MLTIARDEKLFIEVMCVQADSAICAHKILSSPSELSCLQASVWFDISIIFLNEDAVSLLRYLQTSFLKNIDSDFVLAQLLLSMMKSSFFWETLTKSFTDDLLNLNASQTFAWLLLQLVFLLDKASSFYLVIADSSNILNTILKSTDEETQNLDQKIKHVLLLNASELHNDAEAKSEDRHNNDYANHREISIMLIADELLSKDRPFFWTANFIDDLKIVFFRYNIHLDNQFRLLCKNMLDEIWDELKILIDTKTDHHKSIIMNDFSLAEVKMRTDCKRLSWDVVLKCKRKLSHLKKIQSDKRKDFLKKNRHIIRQRNMTCLLIDDESAAFFMIHWNEKKLIKISRIIMIQLADDSTSSYVLFKMKIAENVKLIQFNVATFAFKSFLQCLQKMNDLSLINELLYWKIDKNIEDSFFQSAIIIKTLKSWSEKNLKDFLHFKKNIILYELQINFLCACLFQCISLMQELSDKSWSWSISLSMLMRFRNWKVLHWSSNDENFIWLYLAEDSCSLLHESCTWLIFWRFDECWNIIINYDSTERKVYRLNEVLDDSRASQHQAWSNSMNSDSQIKTKIAEAWN